MKTDLVGKRTLSPACIYCATQTTRVQQGVACVEGRERQLPRCRCAVGIGDLKKHGGERLSDQNTVRLYLLHVDILKST